MKANELRIGNLVLSKGVPVQIEEIMWETVRHCFGEFPIDYVEPIPLTEDWFLKFGFYQSMSWTYAIELKGNFKLVYYLGEKGWSIGFKSYSDFSNLKYVHQLQNLYFALTGDELTEGGEK